MKSGTSFKARYAASIPIDQMSGLKGYGLAPFTFPIISGAANIFVIILVIDSFYSTHNLDIPNPLA